MFRTEKVVKSFEGLTALDGVSLNVDEGSITGLIGPNGSGKTTLFNVITGFLEPSSGDVFFGGDDITNLAPHKVLHRGLGRTFQETEPFGNLSVYENMMIAPLKLSGRNRASRADDLLGFFEIDHLRDETAGSLSYGQQKLLEFARILMTDPDLVLLDEPASGVNPALLERILGYIEQLNDRGLTFVIIEHNMDFIGNVCEDIVVLGNGRIIARGDIEEIQQNERVRDAYFGG